MLLIFTAASTVIPCRRCNLLIMNRLILIFSLLLVALTTRAQGWTVETLPNVQVQDHTKHLVNPDGIISPGVQSQIDSLLLDARRRTSAEIVAVMVNDFDGDDIDEFATDLFNTWNIGKKDNNNGILIFVAKHRRKAAIRTGYGIEGILPDIVAGRILRKTMFPKFKQGDYEGGLLAGVETVCEIVTDPDAADEVHSGQGENYGTSDAIDFFRAYLAIAISVAAMMLIVLLGSLLGLRKKTDTEKYRALVPFKSWALLMSALCMFIPSVVVIPYLLILRRWRNRPRSCARCGSKMNKLDEVHDNDYLSPAQDTEERIKSIDYDVWLCPTCGETEIIPYQVQGSSFQECPQCGGRTCSLTANRILSEPTPTRTGKGQREYSCHNCGYAFAVPYVLPKTATPIIILGGGGGGGRSGGGGSFGGGFGGGFSGGGGASGGW